MRPSPVSCTIDLGAPGKHIGHLAIPKITNTAGWASTFIHIASVANGTGPTVLVLAGNHGDEYEGQMAAMRLLQELAPDQVSGRVIVVPVLSPTASKANTRNWPSGANFNRSFPGRPDGLERPEQCAAPCWGAQRPGANPGFNGPAFRGDHRWP